MNKVILMGRPTRDPEIRYTNSDKAIAAFSLAVNRRFKREGEAEADFISCKAFGKTAEFLEKYVHKGTNVVVEGRIETGSYTNKEGAKVYTTEVICDNVEFAGSKNENQGAGQTQPGGQQARPADKPDDGFMYIPDGIEETLPFN